MASNTKTIYIAVMAAACQLTACSNVDSDDIKTSGIYADVDIESRGSGSTDILVVLTAGNGVGASYIDLDSGDTLRASGGGQTRTLSKNKAFLTNTIEYKTSFDFDTPNTPFTVALDRANGTDAPGSTVTLPEAFSITAPSSGTQYAATDTIGLTWSQSGSGLSMTLHTRIECPLSSGATVSVSKYDTSTDDGMQDISVAQLLDSATAGSQLAGDCSGTVTVERTANGTIDPNYDGGTITAQQTRSISFTILRP